MCRIKEHASVYFGGCLRHIIRVIHAFYGRIKNTDEWKETKVALKKTRTKAHW